MWLTMYGATCISLDLGPVSVLINVMPSMQTKEFNDDGPLPLNSFVCIDGGTTVMSSLHVSILHVCICYHMFCAYASRVSLFSH